MNMIKHICFLVLMTRVNSLAYNSKFIADKPVMLFKFSHNWNVFSHVHDFYSTHILPVPVQLYNGQWQQF